MFELSNYFYLNHLLNLAILKIYYLPYFIIHYHHQNLKNTNVYLKFKYVILTIINSKISSFIIKHHLQYYIIS